MNWRLAKVLYFGTVCLLPLVCLIAYPVIFLRGLDVPNSVLDSIDIYFGIGGVAVLIDLWLSVNERRTKILWTGLLVLVGIVAFPIYWFRFVVRDYKTPNPAVQKNL